MVPHSFRAELLQIRELQDAEICGAGMSSSTPWKHCPGQGIRFFPPWMSLWWSRYR